MTQETLFEIGQAAVRAVADARHEIETDDAQSQHRDDDHDSRLLVSLARQSQRTDDPVERARLAMRIKSLTETIIDASLREASRRGTTWREIGALVGVPFQTLHRRYGGG